MSSTPLPARPDTADGELSTELALHVRAWRRRLDQPGAPAWAPHQRRRTVSQEQVAQRIGCSTKWFARLELGHIENYSDNFIRQVGRALNLDRNETRLLYLLVNKEPPASGRRALRGSLAPLLAAQLFPAYLSDPVWDLVGYNEQMRALFPWAAAQNSNVMRWVFTDPDARRRLYRWETEWAPQMLAQMRTELLRQPHNRRLRELTDEILRHSADARDLWEKPFAYFDPDGERRSLYLPGHAEPREVEIHAMEPLRFPGYRLVVLAITPQAPGEVDH
jgi:transcriptional regulator with XRE-family HTH domain